jgi:two-component system, NarL family, nitrate/nitrite response regulator NarL
MGIRTEVEPRSALLTPLEHEILQLTADGRSAPEIARRLQLTPMNVKTELLSLFEKLGVSDRASAVEAAERDGLLN